MMISVPNLTQLTNTAKKAGKAFEKGSELLVAAGKNRQQLGKASRFVEGIQKAGTITPANINKAPKLAKNLEETREALVTAQQKALPVVGKRLTDAGIDVKKAQTLVTEAGSKKQVVHGLEAVHQQSNLALDAVVTGKNTARQVRTNNLRTSATEGLAQYQARAKKTSDVLEKKHSTIKTLAADANVKAEVDKINQAKQALAKATGTDVDVKKQALEALETAFETTHKVKASDLGRYKGTQYALDPQRQARLNAVLDASEGKSKLVVKGQKAIQHNGSDYTAYYQVSNGGTQKRIAYVTDNTGAKFEVDAAGKPTTTPFVAGTSKITGPVIDRTFQKSQAPTTSVYEGKLGYGQLVEQLRKPAASRGDATDVKNANHGVLANLAIQKSPQGVEYLSVSADVKAPVVMTVRVKDATTGKYVDKAVNAGDTIPKDAQIVGGNMQKLLRHEHANLQDDVGFVQLNKRADEITGRLGTDKDAFQGQHNELLANLNQVSQGEVPQVPPTASNNWFNRRNLLIGTGAAVVATGATAAVANDRTDKTRANKLAEDKFKNQTPGDVKAESETLADLTKGMGYAELGKPSEKSRLDARQLTPQALMDAGFTADASGNYIAPEGELRYTKVTLADGTQEFKTVVGFNQQTQQPVYGNVIHVSKNATGEPTFAFRSSQEQFGQGNRFNGGFLGTGFGTGKAEAPITSTITDANNNKITLGINQGGLIKAENPQMSQAVAEQALVKTFGLEEAQKFAQTAEGKKLLAAMGDAKATYQSSINPNYALNVVNLPDGNQLIVSSTGVALRTPENPQTGSKATMQNVDANYLKQLVGAK
jgi:hypothetical protein